MDNKRKVIVSTAAGLGGFGGGALAHKFKKPTKMGIIFGAVPAGILAYKGTKNMEKKSGVIDKLKGLLKPKKTTWQEVKGFGSGVKKDVAKRFGDMSTKGKITTGVLGTGAVSAPFYLQSKKASLTEYYVKKAGFGDAARLIRAGVSAAPGFAKAEGVGGAAKMLGGTGKAAWGALSGAQKAGVIGAGAFGAGRISK